MNKPFLRNFTLKELSEWFNNYNQPAYRAKQLYEWLWNKNVCQLNEITNIPKKILQRIEEDFLWDKIKIKSTQIASDKTIKVAFELHDNLIIEGVIIPSKNRSTACISTQVGCPICCKFCATGQMGFKRNLNVGEIVDQVILLNSISDQYFQQKLTNIVIMGMGEPFLNYENTIKAVKIVTSPDAMNWSAKRITLSTVGIPNAIMKFADENININLALSLHSAIQSKREQLIPLAQKYNLGELLQALKFYIKKTQMNVTFEYLMLSEFNDTEQDVKELVKICSTIKSKVNLIPYNKVEGTMFLPSNEKRVQWFYDYLKSRNINVRIRQSRGQDIDAACGQLAIKFNNKKVGNL